MPAASIAIQIIEFRKGAAVRERQLLLRLPDTTSMKVVIRIQEAQVSSLSEGLRARVRIVGYAPDAWRDS